MKRQKIGRNIMALAGCAVAMLISFAQPLTANAASDYETKSFDVTMTVNENQSYDVEETIAVNFPEEKHGIYRYIPYSGSLHNIIDGKEVEESYFAKIKKIDVGSDPFDVSYENSEKLIKIGDEDKLVKGAHTYDISYEYQMYNDSDNGQDLFYLNVIPTGWDSSIENASVLIHMPKEFDASKLEVFAGNYGDVKEGLVKYTVTGNDILINSMGELEEGTGVTVRIVLPETYFTKVPSTVFWGIFAGITAIICGIAMLVLFLRCKREPMMIRSIEFQPPEGLSSAELGFLIDGEVEKRDMMSLIIYFASKGYLEIEERSDEEHADEQVESKKKKSGKKKVGGTYLKKIKELPSDAPSYQKIFLDGLFENTKNGEKLEISNIPRSFYEKYDKSVESLKGIYSGEKAIYDDNTGTSQFLVFMIMEAMLVVGGLFLSLQSGDVSNLILFIVPVLLGIGVYILEGKFYVPKYCRQYGKKVLRVVVLSLASVITIGITTTVVELTALDGEKHTFAFGIAMLIGLWAECHMHRRTEYGVGIQGKILGFQDFLETAEKDRLEFLVEENPNFFYDILPYAYALNVTKKWVERFDGIELSPPSWYYNDTADMTVMNYAFLDSLDRTTDSIVTRMDDSRPADIDTSGDSGGYSGGGAGGGGGGAW